MAQGDIIQKDLGLVTAYGYALAGGYQGTEEQFKCDFAALMNGEMCRSYDYTDTSKFSQEPFSISPNFPASFCSSHLYTYGNISFLTISMQLSDSLTVNSGSYVELCRCDSRGNIGNFRDSLKYMQRWASVRNTVGGGGTYDVVEMIGFSDALNPNIGNSFRLWSYVYESWGEYIISSYSMKNVTNSDITLPANTNIVFQDIFLNRVGMYLS